MPNRPRLGKEQPSAAARSAAGSVLDVFLHVITPDRQQRWLSALEGWLNADAAGCLDAALLAAHDLGDQGGRLHRAVARAAAVVDGCEDAGHGELQVAVELFVALRARAALEVVAGRVPDQALRYAVADVDCSLYDHRHACFLLEKDAYRSAIEGAAICEDTWWGMRTAVDREMPCEKFERMLRLPDETLWVSMIARRIRKMCPAPPGHHVSLRGCVDHVEGPVDAVRQIWEWLESKEPLGIVILGSEGSGRTSLMDRVLLDWAQSPRTDLVLVPVLNVMTEFGVAGSAEARATHRLKTLIDEAPHDVLKRLKKKSRVVFVVDGFPPDMQPGIMDTVQLLVELALGGATVIASSSRAVHSAASAIGKLLIEKVPNVREQDRLKRLRLLGISDEERRHLLNMFRKTHPSIGDRDVDTFNDWLKLIPEKESIGGSMYTFSLALSALDAGAFSCAGAQSLAEKEPYLFLTEYLLQVWAVEVGVDAGDVRRAFETFAWDELRHDQPLPPVDKPLIGGGEPSGPRQTASSGPSVLDLPWRLRDRAQLLIQWDDGEAIPTPRFRHRWIRDALVLRFLIRKFEKRNYDLVCEGRQIWRGIRLLAKYAATQRADKLVLDLEQELCRRDASSIEIAEPIFWHLVVNHHRFCHVAVAPNVCKRAAERFRVSMSRLKGGTLPEEDMILHTAAARETALLLDVDKKHTPGAHIKELVELARRTERVEVALTDMITAYYAGRTGAIVRIVEHLKAPRHYGELQLLDLLDLRAIACRSAHSPEFEAELRWAWKELAVVFERKHEEPIVATMQAALRREIASQLKSFDATGAAG
jgi:hypothetical protein